MGRVSIDGRDLGLEKLSEPAHQQPPNAASAPAAESPSPLAPAIAFREEGHYREAAAWLNDWLAAHADDAEAIALLAHVLLVDNQDTAAQAALDRAQAIAADLPCVLRNRARLLLKRSHPTNALTVAQAAYLGDRQNLEGWLVLAAALGANQRDREAMPLIERALQICPNYAEAHASRALIYLRANDTAAALTNLEKALGIKPHLPRLWSLLSSLRYQHKNLPGAIEALQKALQYEPANVE
jgi:tetratricopeptide (TPR) repeat protein